MLLHLSLPVPTSTYLFIELEPTFRWMSTNMYVIRC